MQSPQHGTLTLVSSEHMEALAIPPAFLSANNTDLLLSVPRMHLPIPEALYSQEPSALLCPVTWMPPISMEGAWILEA